jgi:hypothetical protein
VDEKQKKKEYDKPQVTRIRLDAQCAVLGFCKKNPSGAGPALTGCVDAFSSPCLTDGS